jgi:hypothetical protein
MNDAISQDAAVQSQRHSRSGSGDCPGWGPGRWNFGLARIGPADRAKSKGPNIAVESRLPAACCEAMADTNGDFASSARISNGMVLFHGVLSGEILRRADCSSVPAFGNHVTTVLWPLVFPPRERELGGSEMRDFHGPASSAFSASRE